MHFVRDFWTLTGSKHETFEICRGLDNENSDFELLSTCNGGRNRDRCVGESNLFRKIESDPLIVAVGTVALIEEIILTIRKRSQDQKPKPKLSQWWEERRDFYVKKMIFYYFLFFNGFFFSLRWRRQEQEEISLRNLLNKNWIFTLKPQSKITMKRSCDLHALKFFFFCFHQLSVFQKVLMWEKVSWGKLVDNGLDSRVEQRRYTRLPSCHSLRDTCRARGSTTFSYN